MKDTIETAIKALVTKAKNAAHPEAINFAQAAMELARTYATMEATRRENETK
jgi:hypothetical protein